MSRGENSDKSNDTWRDIKQSGNSHALTPEAKKRRILKYLRITSIIIVTLLVLGGGSYAVYTIKMGIRSRSFGLFSPPIKEIIFQTDGRLTRKWFDEYVGLEGDLSMMKIGIFTLKELLEKHKQVRKAQVRREFPGRLYVSIEERKPVLQMIVSYENNIKERLLVDREGSLYKGYGYTRKDILDLKYVEGVDLEVEGEGYKPLKGIDAVVELLEFVRRERPKVYEEFYVVSFEYLQGGREALGSFIKLKTKNMGDLIFLPENFSVQLGRLDAIMNYMTKKQLRNIEYIDLSLEGQATVQLIDKKRKSKNLTYKR